MEKFFYKTRLWGIPMLIVLLAGFAAVVMLLWNALMPAIAGLPAIDYLQAVGILALTRILFGGIGAGLAMGGHPRLRDRNVFREKWMKMTPEEREEFIRKQGHYRHLFGGHCHGDGETGPHETPAKSPDQNQESKHGL
jgi:hypothetical protein